MALVFKPVYTYCACCAYCGLGVAHDRLQCCPERYGSQNSTAVYISSAVYCLPTPLLWIPQPLTNFKPGSQLGKHRHKAVPFRNWTLAAAALHITDSEARRIEKSSWVEPDDGNNLLKLDSTQHLTSSNPSPVPRNTLRSCVSKQNAAKPHSNHHIHIPNHQGENFGLIIVDIQLLWTASDFKMLLLKPTFASHLTPKLRVY